jgi:hypothetical protein
VRWFAESYTKTLKLVDLTKQGKFIMLNIRVPDIIRNNWGKFINAILILTTSLLWAKTRNTEQHVKNLSLQLARQPLDSICFTSNYPIYQPKVHFNETNLISDFYNTYTTRAANFFKPITNYAANYIPYLASRLNRTITTNETTLETKPEYNQPLELCSLAAINNEDTLHSCMAIANTSNQRNAILHHFHNNVGISSLAPEVQRNLAKHIAETNNPHLTRSLTDPNAKAAARELICEFACKAAAKAFGL